MFPEYYILIIQAMQLPVIALLIIFLFDTNISRFIYEDDGKENSALAKIFRIKPLFYLAIGFGFNFLYVVLNIVTKQGISTTLASFSFKYEITLILDITTTFFFMIE